MKDKKNIKISVYLSLGDYDNIIESSTRAGLSMSNFVRQVCLGSQVPSREDAQARRELLKVNADLGRLGGLLKQSITVTGQRDDIRPLLQEISELQKQLKEKILSI